MTINKEFETSTGVDEAGRGALAGPVVVSAVTLINNKLIKELDDSKKLSEKKREDLYLKIIKNTPYIRTAIINSKAIDQINILNATLKGMLYCIKKLKLTSNIIYIDGNTTPKAPKFNMKAIIKGDRLIPSISAASIIAKVTRDTLMKKIHKKFPQYNFNINKGYGTKNHIETVLNYGSCKIHRKTFSVKQQLTLPF